MYSENNGDGSDDGENDTYSNGEVRSDDCYDSDDSDDVDYCGSDGYSEDDDYE